MRKREPRGDRHWRDHLESYERVDIEGLTDSACDELLAMCEKRCPLFSGGHTTYDIEHPEQHQLHLSFWKSRTLFSRVLRWYRMK